VIVAVPPPWPARPENRTTATVAPRRSSSWQTARRDGSSAIRGRNRAACGRDAPRPEAVRHGSPGYSLQVGHRQTRQPGATWRRTGTARLLGNGPERQQTPSAEHSGHHSSGHPARLLITLLGECHGANPPGQRGQPGSPYPGVLARAPRLLPELRTKPCKRIALRFHPGVPLRHKIPAIRCNSATGGAWIAPRRSPVRVRLAPSTPLLLET